MWREVRKEFKARRRDSQRHKEKVNILAWMTTQNNVPRWPNCDIHRDSVSEDNIDVLISNINPLNVSCVALC